MLHVLSSSNIQTLNHLLSMIDSADACVILYNVLGDEAANTALRELRKRSDDVWWVREDLEAEISNSTIPYGGWVALCEQQETIHTWY